jgi:hypothetical protein
MAGEAVIRSSNAFVASNSNCLPALTTKVVPALSFTLQATAIDLAELAISE